MNNMQQLQSNTTLQGEKYRIERVLGQGGFDITCQSIKCLTHCEHNGVKLDHHEYVLSSG